MISLKGSSFDGSGARRRYRTALSSAPRSSSPASIQLYTVLLLILRCRAIAALDIPCSR